MTCGDTSRRLDSGGVDPMPQEHHLLAQERTLAVFQLEPCIMQASEYCVERVDVFVR